MRKIGIFTVGQSSFCIKGIIIREKKVKLFTCNAPGSLQDPCLGLQPCRQIAVKKDKKRKTKKDASALLDLSCTATITGMASTDKILF